MNGKDQSENLTVRINCEQMDKLREIARENETSLNSLIQKIFTQYLNWNERACKAGIIPINSYILEELFARMDDEEILKISDSFYRNEVRGFLLFMNNKFDVESALNSFEAWLNASAQEYTHCIEGCKHNFVVKHNMGKKWSLFCKNTLNSLFNELGCKDIFFEIDESTFSMDLIVTPSLVVND